MSIVTYFVETSQTYLDSAAETQFGSVAATVGTLLVVATTLVVLLVFINMIFQYRAMDGRTAFWLAVKIGLIGIFATNWVQFNAFCLCHPFRDRQHRRRACGLRRGRQSGPLRHFCRRIRPADCGAGRLSECRRVRAELDGGCHARHRRSASALHPRGLAAFILVASRLMIALLIGSPR